ncbi:protein of unknown function [Candidatus Nitrotoga arctica]|uniref:Uncharacterized protein n=1 Tax=Candidatus Nitrotoga arctica TaxID=453162 RepID=A0ABN8AV54_9PROT|nr:protein of unknown function [Candidatus Nitrotoga arctica]
MTQLLVQDMHTRNQQVGKVIEER